MPVAETVTIHVNIDTDPAKSQAKIESLFRQMETRAKMAEKKLDLYEKKMGDIDKTSNKTAKSIHKTDNAFKRLSRTLKGVGNATGKFLAMFTKFSFIAVAAEVALVSVALLSVKLALVSGRLAIKAYQASLAGLGIAAQGVAVVLGSVAAAMREINEVTLAPTIGGSKQAAQALRGAMGDRQLSFYGMEGVREAVNALAKGGVGVDQSYTGILRQLGDYTADPKELADLAAIYAQSKKAGGIDDEIAQKLGEINPSLLAGIEELTEGGVLGENIMDALLSGTADATDEWEGQLGRLNNTVMGTLKGMVPRMFQLFADLGQPFLHTIQTTLVSIEEIIRRSVLRVRGFVTGFGLDKMIPGFLSLFEKVADWTVKIMAKTQNMEGWVEKMMGWWNTIRNYFVDMARIFQPLEEGANALIAILKPQLLPVFEGFSLLIRDFADLLVDNKTDFVAFGDAIGNVFEAIFKWFGNANTAFADALPIWTDFANMVAKDLVPLLGDIFDMMHTASQTILPVVTSALSAVATALSGIATALKAIMSVPGIGQLLALPVAGMMFKSTRTPMLAAAGLGGLTKSGRAQSSMVKAMQKAGIGGAAVAGSSAFGSSLLQGGFKGLSGTMGAAGSSGLRGAAWLAASQLTPLGAGLAMAAPGAAASLPIGTLAGDNIAGAGGMATGILGSAAAGAGLGALVGNAIPIPGVGALLGAGIGGLAGGIGGFFTTRSAQQRQSQLGAADEVADAMMKDFYYHLNMNLSQGQGLSALQGAKTQMETMLDEVSATAEESGVREHDLRDRLTRERQALDVKIEAREDDYKRRLEDIGRITGKTAGEIEELADVTGTDLSDAVTSVSDHITAIGAIDPWRGTVEGIQDTSTGLLYDSLFGGGSKHAKSVVEPEMRDTLNALLSESTAQFQATGEVDGELMKRVVDAQFAYTQEVYGLKGMDLAESLRKDLVRMDEFAGTGTAFQEAYGEDLLRFVDDFKDPAKNPAVQLLQAALLDQEQRKSERLGDGRSPEQIGIDAMTALEDRLARFDPEADSWTGWDEALRGMIMAAEMEIPIDNLTMVTNLIAEQLELTAGNLASFNEVFGFDPNKVGPIAGYQQPSRTGAVDSLGRSGFGSRTSGGGRSDFAGQIASGRAAASTVVKPVSVTQTATSSARYNMSMSFSGLGIQEAMPKIKAEIARAIRNANQRQPRLTWDPIKGGYF